jgi:hypothetical protein
MNKNVTTASIRSYVATFEIVFLKVDSELENCISYTADEEQS